MSGSCCRERQKSLCASLRLPHAEIHSEALIEEFTEMPEAVVVCEKEKGASRLRMTADS